MTLMLFWSGPLPTIWPSTIENVAISSFHENDLLPFKLATPLETNGNVVNQVNEYKYLGVILSSDMSWSSHISATRKFIGVLYRKFYLYSETYALLHLYQSLIRSHIEYACSVWDPHLNKDIERLEGVQKFELKFL